LIWTASPEAGKGICTLVYLGSKNRIASRLLPVMLRERKPNQWWVEPFVGGANMIDKVRGNRIGNDINKYLIALLKAVQCGWAPPIEVSRDMYYDVKNNPGSYSDELVGFVGFLCSYGGKWWGGYAFDSAGTNYAVQRGRSLVKQSSNIKGIQFNCGSYLDMHIPLNSLVYCDPPYAGTTKYNSDIDHGEFWQWCRELAYEGHTVFVSERNAPADFDLIMSVGYGTKMIKSMQGKEGRSKIVEKLYRYKW
jgi:DNA adenine methylase